MRLTRALMRHWPFDNVTVHLAQQPRFIGRTVIVKDGKVEDAFRVLNRILGSEGIFDIYRRTRTYEKPFNVRRRRNWTICKAVYDEDMDRKIKFIMRKNRVDPHPSIID